MPTSEAGLVHRQAARALILTPDHHLLLCRIHAPGGGPGFWIAPGGGLEPGETQDEGLRRELQEELGLSDFEAGPVVWRRHHTFDWGERRISQKEEYRVVHVERFEPPGAGVLLLCSDGLWNYQPEAAGLAGLAMPAAQTDPLGSAQALVKFAIEAGGRDNITAVLIPFPPGTPAEPGPEPAEAGA